MRTQAYACGGRLESILRYYPKLSKTFIEWVTKYAGYKAGRTNGAPFGEKKSTLRSDFRQIFSLEDYSSFEKCVIEFISGMTDLFAIQVYEEIISF